MRSKRVGKEIPSNHRSKAEVTMLVSDKADFREGTTARTERDAA